MKNSKSMPENTCSSRLHLFDRKLQSHCEILSQYKIMVNFFRTFFIDE